MTYFPSHSYEQYYQAIRRSWRFGQRHPVTLDIVTTQGGSHILDNLERKATQADQMFDALLEHMGQAMAVGRDIPFVTRLEVPLWLAS